MRTLLIISFALAALAGCGEDPPRPAAQVEAAVEAYLADRTDLRMGEMRVRADRIRFEGDRALASVSIMASDDPKATMQMVYELALGPEGWKVVPPEASSQGMGVSPEGGDAVPGLPPGHPPTGAPSMELPPGHPPTAPSGELPPGHPPIGGESL